MENAIVHLYYISCIIQIAIWEMKETKGSSIFLGRYVQKGTAYFMDFSLRELHAPAGDRSVLSLLVRLTTGFAR